MTFIKTFSELGKNNVDQAGGKGASLGEMTRAGILVPPGYVIISTAFTHFLDEIGIHDQVKKILKEVKYNDIGSVEKISEKLRKLIEGAKMPKPIEDEIKKAFIKLGSKLVAVRSSATAEDSSDTSWAGELESYLNTTDKTLFTNVKKCWASLFTPRAIVYRNEKNLLTTEVRVAVVVQSMVESEVSGIAFTVHPVTQDRNQMIIEAGWGLGEAIVSGSVTPDSYIIDKKEKTLLDVMISDQGKKIVRCERKGTKWMSVEKKLQSQQKLTGAEILELSDICLRIEKHYGFPCDIEWAFFKKKFYIVQSRPITTLG